MGYIGIYETFKDLVKFCPSPAGHKKIQVHIHHKARLVADGHISKVHVESVYSGIFHSVLSYSF